MHQCWSLLRYYSKRPYQLLGSSILFTYSFDLNESKKFIFNAYHLLVYTKAQDAESAVLSVADHLSDPCLILLIQNAMGRQQAIAQHFSSQT
ncbi:2-dehydropantoate 2-reductase N-terminal domain-containing protein [Endozoicomonas sp. 2B-B]